MAEKRRKYFRYIACSHSDLYREDIIKTRLEFIHVQFFVQYFSIFARFYSMYLQPTDRDQEWGWSSVQKEKHFLAYCKALFKKYENV